ncbi:MAG TPA: response regulator [Sphingomicrobium sp.]|nr:response regulator [Sphingomicrobium sp.]
MTMRIVYVIDDDSAVLHSTGFLLQSLGFEFDAFEDPDEFLAVVDKLQPGCVITDLRMPRLTGSELRRALLDRSIDWPVVMMTSENGTRTTDLVKSGGFSGFLRKPFSADDLVTILDKCFATLEAQTT